MPKVFFCPPPQPLCDPSRNVTRYSWHSGLSIFYSSAFPYVLSLLLLLLKQMFEQWGVRTNSSVTIVTVLGARQRMSLGSIPDTLRLVCSAQVGPAQGPTVSCPGTCLLPSGTHCLLPRDPLSAAQWDPLSAAQWRLSVSSAENDEGVQLSDHLHCVEL